MSDVHYPGAYKGPKKEWPVQEPEREQDEDLCLLVRFPHSAGKHADKLASALARRLQVVFGEDVTTYEAAYPDQIDDGSPEWFRVEPAEGI